MTGNRGQIDAGLDGSKRAICRHAGVMGPGDCVTCDAGTGVDPAPGVWHKDGPLAQIRTMAEWAAAEGDRLYYPDQETLRKIATNLRAAADALEPATSPVTEADHGR